MGLGHITCLWNRRVECRAEQDFPDFALQQRLLQLVDALGQLGDALV